MRRNIYDYFFLFVLAGAGYAFLRLLSPFSGEVLLAVVCSIAFYPMYQAIRRGLPRQSPAFHAGLADFLVFLIFIIPLGLFVWAIVNESSSIIPTLKQGNETVSQWREGNASITTPWLEHIRFFLAKALGVKRAQFQEGVIAWVDRTLEYISLTGALLARNVLRTALKLVIMLFALFFMFHHGERLCSYIQNLIPLRRENKEQLIERLRSSVMGIVRGVLLTAVIQGAAATAGYWIVGAEASVLLGALTACASFVPVIGTMSIWICVGGFFILKGAYLQGGFILLWGLLIIVGLIDLVVRPALVGKNMRLPTVILFFALFGGMEIWGLKGLLLGPLLAAMLPLLLDIYRQRYLRDSLSVAPAHLTIK